MKTINFLLLTLVVIVMSSCEKVIELDLDDAETQLVIEAQLIANENILEVEISKTASYFDNSPLERIEDAVLTLTDDTGESITVPYSSEGTYQVAIAAEEGRTYTLEALVEGEVYQASSTLVSRIPIAEVEVEYEEGGGPIEEGFSLTVRFDDPGGIDNYYRVRHTLNGDLQNEGDDLLVTDDVLFDGGLARLRLFRKSFDAGDIVDVELIHFDKAAYDYFNSLADIIGDGGGSNGGSAAPGNPESNWSGNILGYFIAYSSDNVEVIVE